MIRLIEDMVRRQESFYKVALLLVGVLEVIFGTVSLALGLAAGQQQHQRTVQVAAIITFLSGTYAVALHRAPSVVAYYGSAFAGCVSAIVAFVVAATGLDGFTPVGLLLVIVTTMTFGHVASGLHMIYAIAVVIEAHIRNHDQVRAPRPNLETVEVDRVPAGWCWIVNWLHNYMNPNRKHQTRIQIMPLDAENKAGQKIGVDAAKTSYDLLAHVIASYEPEPPCYDDIAEPHRLAVEKV